MYTCIKFNIVFPVGKIRAAVCVRLASRYYTHGVVERIFYLSMYTARELRFCPVAITHIANAGQSE